MIIPNRRLRSSRNGTNTAQLATTDHTESEIALKPERPRPRQRGHTGSYRIGDCAQAGTTSRRYRRADWIIPNRRLRSSRNWIGRMRGSRRDHTESEIALKPERRRDIAVRIDRSYRIGDCAQAGTAVCGARIRAVIIPNRRLRSSRNCK